MWLLTLLFCIALCSCSSDSYYDTNISIPQGKWHQDSTLSFLIPIEDTTAVFDFFLNLRHNTDYPYANLYLFIHSVTPMGEQAKDTLELQLAQNNGKWLGSGRGGFRYNQFILTKKVRFANIGTYKFNIRQGMRCQQLEGIEDIGMQLTPAKTL